MGEPVTGTPIDIAAADGGRFSGYLALPPSGKGPGVALLHTAFGLDRYMRDTAELLAEEGYVVLCPDLYWRIAPGLDPAESDIDRRRMLALFESFDHAAALADITAAVRALRERPEYAGGIGLVGFCLGGGLAFRAAAETGIDCAVAYYGVGIDAAVDLADHIKCPMVLHFAERDDYVAPDAAARAGEAFTGRGDVQIHTYHGTAHGFARPDGGDYDKPAAGLAHSRTISLLRRTLGPHFDLETLWERHHSMNSAPATSPRRWSPSPMSTISR